MCATGPYKWATYNHQLPCYPFAFYANLGVCYNGRMNKLIIAIVVIVIAGAGVYLVAKKFPGYMSVAQNQIANTTTPPATGNQETDSRNVSVGEEKNSNETVIGKSVENRDIIAYHYGTGDKEILVVGGIHGGYEWNTVLASYELIDYLKANPSLIPANLKVTVIPVLNPDGLNKVVGTAGRFQTSDVPSVLADTVLGRFNTSGVDLNRNFDCKWQATGKWQSKTVSGGSEPFSEPESQALKNYVEKNKPTAAIVYYSAAGGVYASSCDDGISLETRAILKAYANASGYLAYDKFSFYEVTGDAVNWLAKNNIPAISVLLTNHTDTEWTKNQKGFGALLKYYAN